MRCLVMFITAICMLFLLKLKWPKNKNFYHLLHKKIKRLATSLACRTESPTENGQNFPFLCIIWQPFAHKSQDIWARSFRNLLWFNTLHYLIYTLEKCSWTDFRFSYMVRTDMNILFGHVTRKSRPCYYTQGRY